MTFLKKLLNLSGCRKLKPTDDDELVERKDDEGEVLIGGRKAERQNYVPWQSPTISSRRMLSRVRESPRLARRIVSRMTGPDVGRKEREKSEIFLVNISVLHESGMELLPNGRADAW